MAPGAAQVTHALVTTQHAGASCLFAVALNQPGVQIDASGWQAIGMRDIETANVTFSRVPAQQVGASDAYLTRPGFWHGGAGIAACWFGATSAVADVLRTASRVSRDPHAAAHLGAIDAGLAAAGALLRQLAQQIDAQPQDPQMRGVLQVRSVVEAVARDTLDRVSRALGPGPLCGDRVHAQRCADLSVFIRQHHGERDLQALGEALPSTGSRMEDLTGQPIEGAGTPESVWRDAACLSGMPRSSLSQLLQGSPRLVVVAPHPDDEVLGCGGLIAAARAAGVPVLIIALTDGELAYPDEPGWAPHVLGPARRLEARRSRSTSGSVARRVDPSCIG